MTLGLKYFADMKNSPLYDMLRQASIKTEKKLTTFSDFSSKYFPETGRSTGSYMIFYQGGPIDHGTHVPGKGMSLARFRMFIHDFLKKDSDKVPEEGPLIILDGKSSVCMAKNDKDTNYTRHI